MPTAEAQTSTREAILDAADHLFGRFGYRKMTMEDLARQARISRRTIYLYFASKEEVAIASIDRVVDRLTRALSAIAASGGRPEVRLREMLRARVLFRFDSVREYYQGLDDLFAALRPAYLARRESYFEAEARLLAQVLEEGRRAGRFDFDVALPTARILVTATNALLPFGLSVRELGERAEVVSKVTRLADLMVNGLRKKGDPSQ